MSNLDQEKNHEENHDTRLAGLKIHFGVYIGVNLLLFVINFLTGYAYRWHMWPLMSWGIGIALHAVIIYIINIFTKIVQAFHLDLVLVPVLT